MKKFKINISFLKSAKSHDFGFDTEAVSKMGLRAVAIAWARENGYNGAVKNVKRDEAVR